MINIIGCGPGAEEYLTAIARSAINNSDVLIGAQHLLDFAGNDKATKIVVTAHIDDALEDIRKNHADRKQVSVLVSGDPGIFSLAKRVIKEVGLENCRVIPGISSVQTAFARIGVSWNDAVIISAHHQLPDIEDPALNSANKIAVLSGRADAVEWLNKLVARLGKDITIYACENITLADERISKLPASSLSNHTFASRCVFLVIRKDSDI